MYMWVLQLPTKEEKYYKTKKEAIKAFIEQLTILSVQDGANSERNINDFKKNVNNFYNNFYYYYKGENYFKNKTFIFKVTYKEI